MKPEHCLSLILILTVIWFIPRTSLADDEKKSIVLDEVVVSATRTETEVDKAPASVSVVNEEDLERLTINRLDEALRYEAGVFEGKLRGLPSSSHTLLMLNGMPMNSGWYGGHRWENLAVENVDRIEIVRGPGSALYGGNAMGGTINVITKMPEQFEAGLRTRIGSDDNLSYGGYVGDRLGNFHLRLGYERDEEIAGYPFNYVQRSLRSGEGDLSGGFYMPTNSDTPAWIVGDQGDRNDDQWNVDVAAAYDLTDTGSVRFDGQVGNYAYDYDRPHTYVCDADGNPVFSGNVDAGDGQYASFSESNFLSGRGDMTNHAYMATYTERFGALSFTGKFGYQYEYYEYTTPTAASGQGYDDAQGNVKEFDTDTYFTDLQFSFPIGARNTITTGLYGRYNNFDQGQYDLAYYRDTESKTSEKTELTQGKDRYFAFYLQDQLDIIPDRLSLYAGARFDYWEAYDGLSGDVDDPDALDDVDNSALSPKLSLVWQPLKDTMVKGSVGKAFRAPTIYDLYRTYESSSGMVYSNPDLDPETIWNYELGVIHYFFERRIKIGATAFYSDIDNLIYNYKDDENNSHKDNAGQARIQGVELSASATPWDVFSLWANYTYNDSQIIKQDRDPEMEGKKITEMPDQVINIGADLQYRWFKASLSGQYTGRIYKTKYNTDIPDVYKANSETWLWQAKLTSTIPLNANYLDNIQLSFSVENLFDEEYFDYHIGRERSYFAEIKLNW
jgi:iron complex outermembrane receptor protein